MNDRDPSHVLAELRAVGEELRGIFADERHAIGKLDYATLEALTEQKRVAGDRLAALCNAAPAALGRDIKQLLHTVNAEARATAMLAAIANDAVRALLGIEPVGYDRRARQLTTTKRPLIAAY